MWVAILVLFLWQFACTSVSLPAVNTWAITFGSLPIVSLKSPIRIISWSSFTASSMSVSRSLMNIFWDSDCPNCRASIGMFVARGVFYLQQEFLVVRYMLLVSVFLYCLFPIMQIHTNVRICRLLFAAFVLQVVPLYPSYCLGSCLVSPIIITSFC